MRIFYLLIPILMFNACKTQTETVGTSQQTKMTQLKDKTICPDEGTCSVIVYQNSTLTINEDTTGALYPQIEEGDNLVVEYTYLKEGPAGTADGSYSETIHFEIPSNVRSLRKENASLAEVGLLYGKHCFCPGEAGYYPITKGKLSVENTGESITFDVSFDQEKTSQKISRISETVSIE